MHVKIGVYVYLQERINLGVREARLEGVYEGRKLGRAGVEG